MSTKEERAKLILENDAHLRTVVGDYRSKIENQPIRSRLLPLLFKKASN